MQYNEKTLYLSFVADMPTIEGILSLAQEWALEQKILHDDSLSLRLILEELLTNIFFHTKSQSSTPRVDLTVEYLEEKSQLNITIEDNGTPFNPLEYIAQPVDTISTTPTGKRGLHLLRLLTINNKYSAKRGNQLSLTLPLGQYIEQNKSDTSQIQKEQNKGLFSYFYRFWFENLAFKQTIIVTLASAFIFWGGLTLFYIATQGIIYEKIKDFSQQTLNTQSVISSTYLERLADSSIGLVNDLSKVPSSALFLNNANQLEEIFKIGNTLRQFLAEASLLGIVAGNDSEKWLFRFVDGVPVKEPFLHDVSLKITHNTKKALWQTLNINFNSGDPHAAMIYPLYLTENPEDGWIGVIVLMPWIAETLYGLSGFQNAVPIYINSEGQYVIFPTNRQLSSGPQSLADEAKMFDYPKLSTIHKDILAGNIGVSQFENITGKPNTPWNLPWENTSIIYHPMQTKGWFLALLVDTKELGNIELPIPSWLLWAAIIGPFCLGLLTWFVTSHTLRPLHSLTRALNKISQGNLDIPIEQSKYPDEVGIMLNEFEKVRVTLKSSFRNLVETTTEQQRITNELAIAKNIQDSILPQNFPLIPNIEIASSITMALEVYGDLYDYFQDPKNPAICYFTVGDVCGKGIPASLIMSRAISLSRFFLLDGYSPSETLEKVNTSLLRRSNSSMFVTMLTAVFNAETGEIRWSSAGHPPPIVSSKAKGNAYLMNWSNELVLGVRENIKYSLFSHTLEKGESILLYTDGANEAISPPHPQNGDIYGEDRLIDSFNSAWQKENSANSILENIQKDLASFMQDSSPADDISLVIVSRT